MSVQTHYRHRFGNIVYPIKNIFGRKERDHNVQLQSIMNFEILFREGEAIVRNIDEFKPDMMAISELFPIPLALSDFFIEFLVQIYDHHSLPI